jgi:lipopolysaccharide transport system permease protein
MSLMIESFQELNRYRDLLFTWSMREIKIRYKQSILGGLWAILQPLSIAAIFSIIFTLFVQVPVNGAPHLIFYYVALLPWTLFSTALISSTNSMVNNLSLVTKIYFPREIMPLAGVAAALFDFGFAFLIYIGMAVVYRTSLGPSIILLPVLILIELFFTTALALFVAALNVFYRDIRFIVPLVLQLYMYVSPVIYPTSVLPQKLIPVYMLNPMAGIIDAYRSIFVYGQWPQPIYLLSAFLISLILLIASYLYFSKVARSFADLI